MFRLARVGQVAVLATAVVAVVAVTVVSGNAATRLALLGIGEAASREEISRWDIDIRPDGKGLPEGHGSVEQGEIIYADRCASCHGDFGEGSGNYPVLVGGDANDLVTGERPEKTIGSFWPYAPTLFDYIRRAMPFGEAQSLSADETYALTAYLLAMNEVIAEDSVLDARSLTAIRMPNANGFYFSTEPDVVNKPCMRDCTESAVKIDSTARILDVTPDGLPRDEKAQEQASAETKND
jgi:cytochrome c